jgi:hypothetical protein
VPAAEPMPLWEPALQAARMLAEATAAKAYLDRLEIFIEKFCSISS